MLQHLRGAGGGGSPGADIILINAAGDTSQCRELLAPCPLFVHCRRLMQRQLPGYGQVGAHIAILLSDGGKICFRSVPGGELLLLQSLGQLLYCQFRDVHGRPSLLNHLGYKDIAVLLGRCVLQQQIPIHGRADGILPPYVLEPADVRHGFYARGVDLRQLIGKGHHLQ